MKAQTFTRVGKNELHNADKVRFWASKEQAEADDMKHAYSPFGDVGYQLEIVWADSDREFWVLSHNEVQAVGRVKEPDIESDNIIVTWLNLDSKASVLVA